MKLFRTLGRRALGRRIAQWSLFRGTVLAVLVRAVLAVFMSAASAAEPGVSVYQLQFNGFIASRTGDDTLYIIVGSGFLRTLRSNNLDQVIKGWIASHPNVEIVPIDTPGPLGAKFGKQKLQYVWIRRGKDYLNVALIREGVFPAGVMSDPARMFAELPSKLALPSAAVPHPLLSDEQYQALMQRVIDARELARTERKGIWSDDFKQMREEEGLQ